MPTSHWIDCGGERGRGHPRAKIGVLYRWITHARRPRGCTRIYLLLHHDRERDLRDLRRVCVGCSARLENRSKATLRSRRSLALPSLPYEAVVRHFVSTDSGTDPALWPSLIERPAAIQRPVLIRLQFWLLQSCWAHGPCVTRSPSRNSD